MIINGLEKNNIGLVKYCKNALIQKWYYAFGAYGQLSNYEIINYLVTKYPESNNKWKGYLIKSVVEKKHISDCYGLVKGYIFTSSNDNLIYNSKYDINSLNAFSKAKIKGKLNNLPEKEGIILYMKGHVGIYIGNGHFIECVGNGIGMREGIIKNGKIEKGSKFTDWFFDIHLEYLEKEKEDEKLKLIIDKKYYFLNYMVKDGFNYVKLRDIAKILEFDIKYDFVNKTPILNKVIKN